MTLGPSPRDVYLKLLTVASEAGFPILRSGWDHCYYGQVICWDAHYTWAGISALAHEIGHALSKHVLAGISYQALVSQELEAWDVAERVLIRCGFTKWRTFNRIRKKSLRSYIKNSPRFIVFWDVDCTLADTEFANKYLPKNEPDSGPPGNFGPWRQSIVSRGLNVQTMGPLRRVSRAVRPTFGTSCINMAISSRHEEMRDATVAWIKKHVKFLKLRHVNLRQDGDHTAGWVSKLKRIQRYRNQIWNAPIVMFDDDPKVFGALRSGDVFVCLARGWDDPEVKFVGEAPDPAIAHCYKRLRKVLRIGPSNR